MSLVVFLKQYPDLNAWNGAVDAVMCASNALEELGDMLRAKAGITEPGPSKRFVSEQGGASEDQEADGAL